MKVKDAIELLSRKSKNFLCDQDYTQILSLCGEPLKITPKLELAMNHAKKIIDPFFSFLFKPDIETAETQIMLLLNYVMIAQFPIEDQDNLLTQLQENMGYFKLTSYDALNDINLANLIVKLISVNHFQALIIPKPIKKPHTISADLFKESIPTLIFDNECVEREIDPYGPRFDSSLLPTEKKLSLTMKFGTGYKFRQNDFLVELLKNPSLKILDIDENSFDELTIEEWSLLSAALKKSNIVILNVMLDKKFKYLREPYRKELNNILQKNQKKTTLEAETSQALQYNVPCAH